MASIQTSSTNSDYSSPNPGMPNTGLANIRGSSSNKKLLDYANECFRKDKEYRKQFENKWYINIAY